MVEPAESGVAKVARGHPAPMQDPAPQQAASSHRRTFRTCWLCRIGGDGNGEPIGEPVPRARSCGARANCEGVEYLSGLRCVLNAASAWAGLNISANAWIDPSNCPRDR